MPIVTGASFAVVDSSVIVDALTLASASAVRARLITRALVAPALLDYEVVSAVRGLNLGGHLSDARAVEALSDYADLAIDKVGLDPTHLARVWALRSGLTAYDAAYVALADSLGVPLLTRDRTLAADAPGVITELL